MRSDGVQDPQRPRWFATHRIDAGLGPSVEEPLGQRLGPGRQIRVARTTFGLAGRQPLRHRLDPSRLLGPGEPGGDEDDDPVAIAVGAHGATASGAAPHLDERLLLARRPPPSGRHSRGVHRGLRVPSIDLERQRHVQVHTAHDTMRHRQRRAERGRAVAHTSGHVANQPTCGRHDGPTCGMGSIHVPPGSLV